VLTNDIITKAIEKPNNAPPSKVNTTAAGKESAVTKK